MQKYMLDLTNQLINMGNLYLNPITNNSGNYIIGLDRNLSVDGISEEEAKLFLTNDLDIAKRGVFKSHPFISELSKYRQNVIINMVFNLGLTRFNKFTNTIGFLRNKEYTKVSIEMLDSVWASQVKGRAVELSIQMRTGSPPKGSSDELIPQLIRHEFLSLRPYFDTVNKLTIGVGRNLTDVGISKKEATQLLINDIASIESAVYAKYPYIKHISDPRRNALLAMIHNLGIDGFGTFNKLLGFLIIKNYDGACGQMLDSNWARRNYKLSRILAEQLKTNIDIYNS